MTSAIIRGMNCYTTKHPHVCISCEQLLEDCSVLALNSTDRIIQDECEIVRNSSVWLNPPGTLLFFKVLFKVLFEVFYSPTTDTLKTIIRSLTITYIVLMSRRPLTHPIVTLYKCIKFIFKKKLGIYWYNICKCEIK